MQSGRFGRPVRRIGLQNRAIIQGEARAWRTREDDAVNAD
jgi:hypothetical protein